MKRFYYNYLPEERAKELLVKETDMEALEDCIRRHPDPTYGYLIECQYPKHWINVQSFDAPIFLRSPEPSGDEKYLKRTYVPVSAYITKPFTAADDLDAMRQHMELHPDDGVWMLQCTTSGSTILFSFGTSPNPQP